MCTARFNGHLYWGGGGSCHGGCVSRGCTPPLDPEADTPCPLHAGIHPPVNRMTGVKTLPCPKLRLRAAISTRFVTRKPCPEDYAIDQVTVQVLVAFVQQRILYYLVGKVGLTS